MTDFNEHKKNIDLNGFTIIEKIFTDAETVYIINVINKAACSILTDRMATGLYAMRRFFKEIPEAAKLIFNEKLRSIIKDVFGNEYFVVKSIYFDKPPQSNWFVSYHQDLTISINRKVDLPGFNKKDR